MHRRSSQPSTGAPVIARIRIGPVSAAEADQVEASIARVMEVVGGRDYLLRDGGIGIHRYISVRLPGTIQAEASDADRRELGY